MPQLLLRPPQTPREKPDLMHQALNALEKGLSPRAAQGLVGLGLLLALASALPLLQALGEASLVWVLWAYSLGMWGAGRQLRLDFPWTSRALWALALLSLPLDALALYAHGAEGWLRVGLAVLGFGLLALGVWASLRQLQSGHLQRGYAVCLLALISSPLWLADALQSLLRDGGWDAWCVELALLVLGSALLSLGLWQLGRQLWVWEDRHNLGEALFLAAMLVYAWGMTRSVMPQLYFAEGVPLALALALLLLSGQLRRLRALHGEELWPLVGKAGLLACEALAALLALAVSLGGEMGWLQAVAAVQLLYLATLAAAVWVRWPLVVGASLALLLAGYRLLENPSHPAQSLMLAGLGCLLVLSARWPLWDASALMQRWRQHCCVASVPLLLCAWWEVYAQGDGSPLMLGTLALLTLAAGGLTLLLQRVVLGYLTVASGAMLFCLALLQFDPLVSLSAWRWLALSLGFVMLSCAWLIERLSPGRPSPPRVGALLQAVAGRQRFGEARHLPDPYRFRHRYVSAVPALFAEPLYNLALLLVTATWLLDLTEGSFGLLAALFYALIWSVYPRRIWIYLVLLGVSHGLWGWSAAFLPERYQSWSLLLLSLGWLFAGTLLEELVETHKSAEKHWARPCFHVALSLHVLVLHHCFGSLQSLVARELSPWTLLEEGLPLLVAGFCSLFKLRIYASKLWFYPALLTLMLGLHLSLSALLPLEGALVTLTLIACLWALVARAWQDWPPLARSWEAWVAARGPAGPLPPHVAQIHLERPDSPFVQLALLSALVSLAFSLLLIPAQLWQWEQIAEFSLLTQARPLWLDVFQLLNFLLLLGLFAGGLPLRSAAARPFQDSLLLVCASGALLWLFRWRLNAEVLPLALLFLACGWQLAELLAVQLLPSFRRSLDMAIWVLAGGGLLLLGWGQSWQADGQSVLVLTCLLVLRWLSQPRPGTLVLAVAVANLSWQWLFWQGFLLNSSPETPLFWALGVHGVLLPPALSALGLARWLIRRQPERDQLAYLGLSLLVLIPLSLLMLRGMAGPAFWFWLELGAEVLVLLALALHWRWRALLYTAACVGSCLTLIWCLGLLIHGGFWLRWGLCLGLGAALTVGGLALQQHGEVWRWRLTSWRQDWLSWD